MVYRSNIGRELRQPATYYHVKGCDTRIQIHQGGTRSGKTYSILQSIVELCYENENAGAVITIARKTFPALRATAMRDFFEILEREDIYNPDFHNKSEANYILFRQPRGVHQRRPAAEGPR